MGWHIDLRVVKLTDLKYAGINIGRENPIMEEIHYRPIGIVQTPSKTKAGMPIQPTGAEGVRGSVKIKRDYKDKG